MRTFVISLLSALAVSNAQPTVASNNAVGVNNVVHRDATTAGKAPIQELLAYVENLEKEWVKEHGDSNEISHLLEAEIKYLTSLEGSSPQKRDAGRKDSSRDAPSKAPINDLISYLEKLEKKWAAKHGESNPVTQLLESEIKYLQQLVGATQKRSTENNSSDSTLVKDLIEALVVFAEGLKKALNEVHASSPEFNAFFNEIINYLKELEGSPQKRAADGSSSVFGSPYEILETIIIVFEGFLDRIFG